MIGASKNSPLLLSVMACLVLCLQACRSRSDFVGKVHYCYAHGAIAAVAIPDLHPEEALPLSEVGLEVEEAVQQTIRSTATASNLQVFSGSIPIERDAFGAPPRIKADAIDITCPDVADMIAAADTNNPQRIGYLLRHGHAVDERLPQDRRTPLLWAASASSVEAVKALLAAGAQPNMRAYDGTSPLLMASAAGNVKIVELLLSAGADPNIQDKIGRTPLFAAVEHENLEVIKRLLAAGAGRYVKDARGREPCALPEASKEAISTALNCVGPP